MPAKLLKVDSLDLDLENPRITLAVDQRDAMQKLLNEQKIKLINLAESIADKGLNPMDRFLILRSHLRSGKFIVLEGNRRPVHAFWRSVLDYPDELCKRILDTRVSVRNWDKHKRIMQNPTEHDALDLGFATFFLNRTNRSGILNGGIIGGRAQTGPWKIDARYNARELAYRVESIAKMRHRIRLTRQDALKFLAVGITRWPNDTLIYLDPPYYLKGRDLYYDFYEHKDHETIARFVRARIKRQRWIVSYDDTPEIRTLYRGQQKVVYRIGYSARCSTRGREIMFFDEDLRIPELVSSLGSAR